jgi:hypothetical protein
MANRKNTFLLKRSNVVNKAPSLGDIQLGEIALNTADAKLFSTYTGGLTGATEIREIGWDRLSTISGGTVNGDVIINADLTVTGDTQLVNVSGTSFYTDYIDFNNTLSPLPTDIEGRIYWDDDNGSLTLGMHGGQVLQQIGLEQYYYIKNQSGSTISNGRVVRSAGTLGSSSRILGEYMIADGTIPANFTLGVATEDIVDGDDGYVTNFGLVRNINTTGSLYGETWSGGTILYVSPTIPGGLTSVEPSAPDLKIEMAIVIKAHSNGSIFVRPTIYPHLYDLQEINYSAGTETNLDILQWNGSNQTWDKTNTPSFSGLTIYNNINHLGNYILDGNISQTGDYSVTGDTSINGNLDVTDTVNIGTLGTGTSVNTLGIDSNGYVVSATTKNIVEIMYFNTITTNLSDNTNYTFTTNTSLTTGSINTTPGIPLPIGTIVGWRFSTYWASTPVGSSETGTLKLYWGSGPSEVTLSTAITWDGARTAVFSGTLSQAISAVEPSWAFVTTPTFATNPQGVKMVLILQIEI